MLTKLIRNMRVGIEKKILSQVLALLQRVMISFGQPVCTSLVIGVRCVQMNTTYQVISFVLSILLTLLLFVIPVYFAWFIIKNTERHSDDDFKPRYGVLYHRLIRQNNYTATFNSVILYRSMIFTLTLGLFFSLELQIAMMIFVNFLFIVYVLIHRPFDETKENLNMIILEGGFLLSLLLLPLLISGYNK